MNGTHASFFSGVGGLDLGLERAGWRTVSFSEINPYASAVLSERWPGVPNLGDITNIARAGIGGRAPGQDPRDGDLVRLAERSALRVGDVGGRDAGAVGEPGSWRDADLWTGGFPCQDLSVAGKRRGMGAGTRSGLAFSFLDLVGRHRPRFVLLENVPGLLSSHGGKDFGTLLATLVELGYGVGYRILDARYFGVPQRRRRVFILGDSLGGRAGAERAAEVLSVGSRCHRHPPTGIEAGGDVTDRARPGVDIARTVVGTAGKRHDEDIDTLVPTVRSHSRPGSNSDGLLAYGLRASDGHHGWSSPRGDGGDNLVSASPDSDRMRAPHGLAGRPHDRDGLADTLRVGGRASGAGDSYDNTPWIVNALDQRRGGADDNEAQAGHLVTAFTKSHRAASVDDSETWVEGEVAPTLNDFDTGDTRAVSLALGGRGVINDPLLPLGLDSHRYRCCGNGVVADVAEWIGQRLLESL